MSTPAPELSIVIPCWNEIENVRAITAAVTLEAVRHARSHEIILIDNGSTDGTRDAIRALCAADPRVRGILNTRNFGQMRSPTHGIYQARGAAVIGMCADFQDPPAMIGELVQRWRGGAQIVLGQRRSERTGVLLGLVRRAGYALLGRVADYPVLPNVTGFGLFDRRVVETLRQWHEPEPFFRGMLVESGYPVALVPFDRPERAAGETKNGIASLVGFALSGLAGSAKTLLRLPIPLSIGIALIALLLAAAGIVAAIMGGPAGALLGWSAGSAMFATLLLFLGLIGDQVRLIAERTRGVPLVVEEDRLNFPDGP
ncbi:glycosyltransferase family 2 protein [Sphingomonas sp. ac-8]|uniref:glycosyltransferase family 2 protein n=1 Tax=Sphingomonas sp. ac-8 TaxID=3242977 RepID=UPI003A804908